MIKILIVDDEPINIDLLEARLDDFSIDGKPITTVSACNGQEAVNICRKTQDINLILMDMKMPVMNGPDAAKAIKEFLNIPIICVSAYERDVLKEELKKYGKLFDFSISKPIDWDCLFGKIEEIYTKK